MKNDITGALLQLTIQYERTEIKCKEGASDVNVDWRTPITLIIYKFYRIKHIQSKCFFTQALEHF